MGCFGKTKWSSSCLSSTNPFVGRAGGVFVEQSQPEAKSF